MTTLARQEMHKCLKHPASASVHSYKWTTYKQMYNNSGDCGLWKCRNYHAHSTVYKSKLYCTPSGANKQL